MKNVVEKIQSEQALALNLVTKIELVDKKDDADFDHFDFHSPNLPFINYSLYDISYHRPTHGLISTRTIMPCKATPRHPTACKIPRS